MKQALVYKKVDNKKIQCKTCSQFCLIGLNEFGLCGVKKNIDGELYSLNYGKIIAENIDPIEKKPLCEFMPGTKTYSIASAGCNFECANCQNWQISQSPKINKVIPGQEIPPEEIIKKTISSNCPSISYTYTEPTISVEFFLEIMKLARKNNLKNIWVTNGFMSQETLKSIIPFLDAVNVDLKSFDNGFYEKYCQGKLYPILENLKEMRKNNIWIEITTLIIPELTDNKKMLKKLALFIKTELGENTPWHISRFFPEISWKLRKLPYTPLKTIEKIEQIGLECGLRHIYKGNI